MTIAIGAPAPEFRLPDSTRQEVSAAELWRDRNLLVVFYPFAFSPVCEGELCRVRDELDQYRQAGTQVVGISVDSPFALHAWSAQQGFDFPLLADFWPHGEVARAYGVFDEQRGMALRGTFLVERGGTVRFSEVHGPGDPRDQDGWKKAVASLEG
ncbi:peroxiredoxin [Streptomyces sp. V4-01]|uniref:Peroxiredoxin n=1 Tax=Actinacidiphila polyblastidii TaxID=3110430 RepID=A0ABU7PDH3_9ACTN|nr:peroxiredoxin [Streptomyces sp. V4-01]